MSAGRLAGLLVPAVLGIVLRAAPWTQSNVLSGVLEYDDGVYYASARALLAGRLPYRDVLLLHPPLVPVLLLPAAVVGRLAGDPVGLASARVAVLLVGVLNTVLVHDATRRLLRRAGSGPLRACWGAALAATAYACSPAAVLAERTVLLEPLVDVAVLLALRALLHDGRGTPRSRAARCGTWLGLALCVKAFAAAHVVGVLVVLLAAGRRREAAVVARRVGLVLAVVVGPFLVLAPGRVVHDLVVVQLVRPADGGLSPAQRVADLLGARPPGGWSAGTGTGQGAVLAAAVVAALLLAGVAVRVGRRVPGLALYTVGGGVAAAAFAVSGSYFTHYGAVLAPHLAVLLGCAAALPARRRGSVAVAPAVVWRTLPGRLRPALPALLPVVLALVAATSSLRLLAVPSAQSDLRAAAARTVPAGACTWSDSVSLLVSADRFTVPSRRCPGWVDGRGVALASGAGQHRGDYYPAGLVADEPWQRETRRQLAHASSLVVRGDPTRLPEWSTATRDVVRAQFVRVATGTGASRWQVWARSRPAS